MKKLLSISLIVYMIASTLTAYAADEIMTKNIVVFHSYHSNLDWTDELQEGIVKNLNLQEVQVYVEYMDSYRASSPEHRTLLLDYYKERYKSVDVEVVVVVDNYAYDFMSEFYEELFEGVPMIFAGINGFSTEDIFYDQSSGVSQTSNQKETIELIQSLHPKVTNIIALGGTNATARAEIETIIEEGTQYFPELEFVAIASDNLEDQIDQLSEYGEESAIIISGAMRDKSNKFYNHSQYSGAIIEATGLPVYAMGDIYLGESGAIGGYVIDAEDQGVFIADYVNRILDGELIKDLPIDYKPKAVYMFDYNRLKEFKIALSALPEDSVILNSPESTMNIKKLYIIFYLIGLSMLVLLVVVMFINNKKRKAAEIQLSKHNDILKHMAFHESTTNLYNRKYMVEYLQTHLLKIENSFTVFYDIDIVNLKMINETYGYEMGCKIQKHIATLLKKTFKRQKQCVAVYQSEFLIVDSDVISKDLAIEKAEQLIQLIAKSIAIESMEIDIKVNIGIAFAPEHSTDAVQLMKKANIALVECLKEGPCRYKIFKDTLYKDVLKRITLEKQLRRAIVFNEFELYYQPKIDIKAMKVSGCEALIRWNHPDGKLVYPNDFIPLAEEVGLIDDIGQWVVKEATSQAKEWSLMGYNIKVSLNVSGKEFDDDCVQNIKNVIEEIDVDPRLLEIEITETAALNDIEHSRLLVGSLVNTGISVSLDDFGTGYSSMTYIKRLKATKLKIDKSFVDDLGDYEQKVVVDSMIQLGKKLDYIINVEGVETEEQLRILKYLGVDEIQGWYFSKAVSVTDFIKYVDTFGKE